MWTGKFSTSLPDASQVAFATWNGLKNQKSRVLAERPERRFVYLAGLEAETTCILTFDQFKAAQAQSLIYPDTSIDLANYISKCERGERDPISIAAKMYNERYRTFTNMRKGKAGVIEGVVEKRLPSG